MCVFVCWGTGVEVIAVDAPLGLSQCVWSLQEECVIRNLYLITMTYKMTSPAPDGACPHGFLSPKGWLQDEVPGLLRPSHES